MVEHDKLYSGLLIAFSICFVVGLLMAVITGAMIFPDIDKIDPETKEKVKIPAVKWVFFGIGCFLLFASLVILVAWLIVYIVKEKASKKSMDKKEIVKKKSQTPNDSEKSKEKKEIVKITPQTMGDLDENFTDDTSSVSSYSSIPSETSESPEPLFYQKQSKMSKQSDRKEEKTPFKCSEEGKKLYEDFRVGSGTALGRAKEFLETCKLDDIKENIPANMSPYTECKNRNNIKELYDCMNPVEVGSGDDVFPLRPRQLNSVPIGLPIKKQTLVDLDPSSKTDVSCDNLIRSSSENTDKASRLRELRRQYNANTRCTGDYDKLVGKRLIDDLIMENENSEGFIKAYCKFN